MIFTKAEQQAINKRLKGDKSDSTGIFSSRVKPKIKELLELFKDKKKYERLINNIRD